jgi:hypothetical protein
VLAGAGFLVLSGFLVCADAPQQIAIKASDANRFFIVGLLGTTGNVAVLLLLCSIENKGVEIKEGFYILGKM